MPSPPPSPSSPSRSAPTSTALSYLVAGAFFMEALDGTVVITALPQMAASFGAAPVDLNIGVSAYILTVAILIPASGWAAERFGARTVFALAITLFTLASILCGLSQDLWSFVAARILQGVGGAMMVPVGRLVVLRDTQKSGLMRAIAIITWPGLVAPVLGPPIGGFLATHASWHWIFFLNVPLGILALILTLVLVPRGRRDSPGPFDGLGFILSGTACFCLIYGLDLISRGDVWTSGALCLVGLLGGFLALRHSRHRERPLIDLWAMRQRSFAVTIFGGTLFRLTLSATPFLLALLFQLSFGMDAFASGLLVLAIFVGNLAMKLLTSPILRRFSFRATLLVNGGLNALTIFACALLDAGTPTAVILGLLFVSGLTRSLQFTALNTLAFADVPQERMTGANTLANVAQRMSGALGVACGAVALRLAGAIGEGAATPLELADFRFAFVLIGVISLLGLLDVIGLRRDAGDEVRGVIAAR
ncbi:MFS transporter [Rhodospirillum rubrum]|uniref:MFS transporter n=1 Tax=Rhodospirillum rubrum TaxID=1085 RepID=UPI00190399B8|nr:MFS transporter [Rhodospirillum rubrum]